MVIALLAACVQPGPVYHPIAAMEVREAARNSHDPAGDSPALAAFFERIHADRLALDPIHAAYLGLPHDDTQWTPLGEAQREKVALLERRWLAEARGFEAEHGAHLDEDDMLSLRLFQIEQERRLAEYPWRYHEYTMTHISGPHTWVPSFLMTVHRIEDARSASTWIARVRNAGPLLVQVVDDIRAKERLGIRPPALCFPQMLEAIDNLTTGEPFDTGAPSPLLAHFDGALAGLDLDDAQKAALRDQAAAALKDDLGPAYATLREVLVAQSDGYTDDHGVWALPDGEAYYAEALRQATTTDLSADAIHALGLQEVARIQDEMRALMPALGVTGDLQDLYAHLREHRGYTLPDTDAGREAYLERARGYVTGMESVLPEVFAHLPDQPLVVRRVEPWRENGAGKAFYQSPSPDGSRPGIFYANLAHMRDMPVYQLEALVYHEGIPGHHLQNAVSQTLDDLPPFRRFGHYTVYGEGWGLYSELLAKELGFYTDPASDVGRLAMELWRAARLVVDTGLHARKWTREEAVAYLVEQTPNPRGDAEKAVERYLVWPGQATAYKIGMLELLRMREEARTELGDAFDLRGFHGVVLGSGPMPMSELEARVDAWVEETR